MLNQIEEEVQGESGKWEKSPFPLNSFKSECNCKVKNCTLNDDSMKVKFSGEGDVLDFSGGA